MRCRSLCRWMSSFPRGIVLKTDSYTSPVLRYRRCDRDGCYVEMAVDKGLVEALAKASPDAKATVNIVADNGKAFALTFSLKGFAGAHDHMVSKARAKAKSVSASRRRMRRPPRRRLRSSCDAQLNEKGRS